MTFFLGIGKRSIEGCTLVGTPLRLMIAYSLNCGTLVRQFNQVAPTRAPLAT